MRMPQSSWTAVLLVVCSTASVRAAQFPYTAYANSDDVYVRSGPGKDYYPTEKLRKGDEVEVYRHDPGGWCAIRPPRESFSWVPARDLRPDRGRLAVVTSDRALAHVGSAFSDLREVHQVRLDKGEQVEILEIGDPWCKIAPPSGEFRWVYGKLLDREQPDDDPPARASAGRHGQSRHDSTDGIEATAAADRALHFRPAHAQRDGDREQRPIRFASAARSDRGALHVQKEDTDEDRDDSDQPRPDAGIWKHSERAGTRVVARPETFERALSDIDLELSAMVVEDHSTWSFANLHSRAEAALDSAQTALERGRARTLLGKIERFEDIQRRHESIRKVTAETDRRNLLAGRAGPLRGETGSSKFDAEGRLAPVWEHKIGYPQFALVDDKGDLKCFVTPAPGVNLRPYVNQQIGVNGPRDYISDLGRQRINVQRVTQVGDAPRRY